MMMRTIVSLAMLFACVSNSFGVENRLLVPVVIEGSVQGAQGSEWTSVLAVTNTGASDIRISPVASPSCRINLCTPLKIVPGETVYPHSRLAEGSTGSLLLHVEGTLPEIAVSLRIRDVSRELETWGTDIPTIHLDEADHDEIHLLDIPLLPEFRSMLRIYNLGDPSSRQFDLKFYDLDPASTVAEISDANVFETAVSTPQIEAETAESHPPVLAIPLDTLLAENGVNVERVRVVVTSPSTGRFWAFVSVTNNDTQHVTIVQPSGISTKSN